MPRPRSYVHGVEHFSQYFHRSPDQLGPEHIRKYQAMLFSKLRFGPNTVTLRLASLRFFYIKVLKRSWSIAETPYPRKVIRLPEILSQEEVARLIDAAELPFYRMLLMTPYGTGARRTEVAHLKVGDCRPYADQTGQGVGNWCPPIASEKLARSRLQGRDLFR